MSYPKPLILELDSSQPKLCGQIHGESLRAHVRAMAEIRLELMLKETNFSSAKQVLEVAQAHLPILKSFDEELYLELQGIAEGSGLPATHIVVLNHYTDMRDINPNFSSDTEESKGCSTVYVPTNDGPLLGQTWDIDGSALEHVVILKIKQKDQAKVLLFSVAGCLGMTGMNAHSVGICINNLSSLDARVGIVWPALVRKILKQKTANAACALTLQASLGSGHHYTIADEQEFFGIETSGIKKKITQKGSEKMHFHTNHCLDEEMRLTHTVKETSTTFQRQKELENRLPNTPIASLNDLYELLGHVSIPPNPKNIHTVATCGALVMNLKNHSALASMGPPSQSLFHNPPTYLDLA